jgi:hypothetical protein
MEMEQRIIRIFYARRGILTQRCNSWIYGRACLSGKAYPFPSGMINILYVMGFAARPIARSERKAA